MFAAARDLAVALVLALLELEELLIFDCAQQAAMRRGTLI